MSIKTVGLIHPQSIFEESLAAAIDESPKLNVIRGRKQVSKKLGSIDCLVSGTLDLRPEIFEITRVIAIADFVVETALFAKACGCAALVSTDDTIDSLIDAIKRSNSRPTYSPSVKSILDSPAAKELGYFRKKLSKTDIEVFKALSWTQQAKKISKRLGFSERTVYRSMQKISTINNDVSRDELQIISRNIFGSIKSVNESGTILTSWHDPATKRKGSAIKK